jgi:cell fate regulator YaaT (PSP1 superfamily)
MKMAKDQGLAQNPQRLSGVCGRLLCCLVYEEAYYRAQRKLVPRPGEQVTTKQGNGRVRDVDVLEMQVRVVLDSGELLTFEAADVQPLHPRRPDEPEDDASSRR